MPASPAAHEFSHFFSQVDDPRIERSKVHPLLDILFISVAGTIAGCEGPCDIEEFARTQMEWCRKFVPLPHGVPSHDTIGRVLSLIKPEQFQQAVLDWIASFARGDGDAHDGQPRFVPIDGKTLRGSGGASDRVKPLHLVSAWATAQGLTLGQVAVDDKSNEITAIPKLLTMLELKGAIVSIDAMGCQKEIAKQIIVEGGDYVLAVKDNQPTLHNDVRDFFTARRELEDYTDYGCRQYTTTERSRGRIETRYFMIAPLPESLKHHARSWKGLTSIGQVISIIESEGKETFDIRYYITSRQGKVREFATATRGHWSIESMHWILDVVFAEDSSRIREGHAAENFGCIRKFVLSLLKQDTSLESLKRKRKKAAWSTDFIEKLLFG